MAGSDEIEERLRLLEAHVETQEQVILGLHSERLEEGRLNDSVMRLGMGASDLGEALRTVDRNLLVQFGQDLNQVKGTAATTRELDAKVAAAQATGRESLQEQRRIMMGRFYGAGILVVALLAGISLIAVNAANSSARGDRELCLSSTRVASAVGSYLAEVERVSTNEDLRVSARELLETLPASNLDGCSQ